MTQEQTNTNPFIPMTFSAFVTKAMTYRLPSADAVYARDNLVAEVGECFGLIAKRHRDGPYTKVKNDEVKRLIKKELGDILWQLAAVCQDEGTSLEEVALINLVKLRDRKEAGTIQGAGDDR